MTPNLRSVVAQGWRSIRSRNNFSSSSSGSTNCKVLSETFDGDLWIMAGYGIYCGQEIFYVLNVHRRGLAFEAKEKIRLEAQKKRRFVESSVNE